jgi:membrane protease YdiL (CAAX protease family)
MAAGPSSKAQNKPQPEGDVRSSSSLLVRAARFALFLVCALAVFLLGANYYKLFPTNGSSLYAGSLSAVFLIAALACKLSPKFSKYWQILYAFFTASMVNLVSDLLSGYFIPIAQFLGLLQGTNEFMGLAKLYDTLLVVIPILALIRLSGADLGSLYIKKGNRSYVWGLGIGALVLVNYLTSALIFYGNGYRLDRLGPAIIWGLFFALCNGLLEELWVRGLFVKRLVALVGVTGTVLVTSIWFASLHFLAVAYLPASVVPVFVVNTFTLGLACSILMIKTDSIWGAYLIHAAADLFLFVAILAVH